MELAERAFAFRDSTSEFDNQANSTAQDKVLGLGAADPLAGFASVESRGVVLFRQAGIRECRTNHQAVTVCMKRK